MTHNVSTLASLWRGTAIANEVAQISAISDAGPESADEDGPTPEEEAAYVREVAQQKTAALKMSLRAVEEQNMPFLGEERD